MNGSRLGEGPWQLRRVFVEDCQGYDVCVEWVFRDRYGSRGDGGYVLAPGEGGSGPPHPPQRACRRGTPSAPVCDVPGAINTYVMGYFSYSKSETKSPVAGARTVLTGGGCGRSASSSLAGRLPAVTPRSKLRVEVVHAIEVHTNARMVFGQLPKIT